MMGATKQGEYCRTAEMLVSVSEQQGIYFAIALLYDMQYSREDIGKLLPILQDTRGSKG